MAEQWGGKDGGKDSSKDGGKDGGKDGSGPRAVSKRDSLASMHAASSSQRSLVVDGTDDSLNPPRSPDAAAAAAADAAFDERVITLFRVCESRLERLLQSVTLQCGADGDVSVRGGEDSTSASMVGSLAPSLKGGSSSATPRHSRRSAGTGGESRSGSISADADGSAPAPPPKVRGVSGVAVLSSASSSVPTPPVARRSMSGQLRASSAAPSSLRASALNSQLESRAFLTELPTATTAHNIRVAPPEDTAGSRAVDTAAPDHPPGARLMTRRASSLSASTPASAGEERGDEDGEEAERSGFFGEERRRVKVGERLPSARQLTAGGLHSHGAPTPPPFSFASASSARDVASASLRGSRRLKTPGARVGLGGRPLSSRT